MPIVQTHKELQPRHDYDFYITPYAFVEATLSKLREKFNPQPYLVLDPGAGDGVWGRGVRRYWDDCILAGIELRDVPGTHDYNIWYAEQDYLLENMADYDAGRYNLIIGNPPFKFAERFVWHSYDLLAPDGFLVFLLRLQFLESKRRFKDLYNNGRRPREVWVSTRRVPFRGEGDRGTDADAYGVFIWQKGYTGDTQLDWMDWDLGRLV